MQTNAHSTRLPESATSGAAARILLVEDSPEDALLVQRLLREELGRAVAIEHRVSLEEAKGPLLGEVDCVLLDLSLPDASGLEALEAVRLRAPAVPVVVLSGEEDDVLAVQAVHEGAQDYLVKRHVDGRLLGRSIRHSIERKRGELELAHQATRDPHAAPGALVRAADETMHRAKQAGSRWQLFDAAIAAAPPLTPEGALRRALEQDELRMYYQPEVDLAAGEIVGVESLMRWQHPERGVLPPGEFIPLAEETGLIVDLGEWAIRESCRQLARWREAGACAPDLTASVNLSARQLSDRTLPETVERILRETGVPPTGLCLELTESTLVSDLDGCAQALGDLRDIGVRIGLDDFGTGYSSLSVLDRYPLDKLKIDRSFVWRLEAGERSRRVFRAVVGLAHALGLSAVAEGVETPEQLADITALGCDTAQGFYLARPQEPARVTPLLAGRLPAAA